jgi:hypothetical protein
MSISEKYQDALHRIPAPGAGCHGALLGVANLGAIAGLSDCQIHDDIRGAIPAGARRVSDKEIREAVTKARREFKPNGPLAPYTPTYRPTPKPLIDGPATLRKLIDAGAGTTAEDITAISPVKIDWAPGHLDSLAVLSLYDGEERLFLGDQYGRTVKAVSEWREEIQSRSWAFWPHLAPNPVDGIAHDLGEGKKSFRCDAAVSALRYAVVEFDNLPKSEQLAFWGAVISKKLLNVALLMDSGGKSIHAWIRVDLPDRNAWDKVIGGQFYGEAGVFTAMGADRACKNCSRLSRLAGHYRKEKNAWQKLLYLNP